MLPPNVGGDTEISLSGGIIGVTSIIGGGLNPPPGSVTMICGTVPIPPTALLHGGGIKTALTPVGFTLQDLSSNICSGTRHMLFLLLHK